MLFFFFGFGTLQDVKHPQHAGISVFQKPQGECDYLANRDIYWRNPKSQSHVSDQLGRFTIIQVGQGGMENQLRGLLHFYPDFTLKISNRVA